MYEDQKAVCLGLRLSTTTCCGLVCWSLDLGELCCIPLTLHARADANLRRTSEQIIKTHRDPKLRLEGPLQCEFYRALFVDMVRFS